MTTHISRLLRGLLLIAGLAIVACTNERQDETFPDGGNPTSTERRAVLITLKNKLALLPPGGAATRGIATSAENAIASLDVYAFGADQEDGTYTYMSRFAYRADGNPLPKGAAELQLNIDAEGAGTTSGLISLRKGLFVKLYCVANDTLLVEPTLDQPMGAIDFVPITYTEPAEPGNPIARAGTPTLDQFLTYRTRLLAAGAVADTLATPLAMSGAYTTPLDLTDTENVTRLQVGFKLTRLAARFDVLNQAVDSRLTIQSIGMGKGRRAAGYFPIRPQGSQPAGADELITCPSRAFAGATANAGLTTGAFYSYPSPSGDESYLILKGLYKINETEQQEVSYQVPFRQTTQDGRETYLEINNNHRYTVNISKADPNHLEVNFSVADWADDGSLDYVPENEPGEATVTIPDEFADETNDAYDAQRNIHTVTMSLEAGSAFDYHIGATSALTLVSTYAGGVAARKYDWLEITEVPATRVATANFRYHFALREGYLLGRYPRATVRISDALSGTETILFVDALSVPQLNETPQPTKAPNGTSDNPNTYNPDAMEATFYRIPSSFAKVVVNCAEGTDVFSSPDWLTVEKESVKGAATTFSLTLNDRDVEVEGNTATVVFVNSDFPELKTNLTVNLMDAAVKTGFANVGPDNSYTPPTAEVPGNITLKIADGNIAVVTTEALDGVTVKLGFNGGPAWLKSNGDAAPASTTTRAAAPVAPAAAAAAAAPAAPTKKQDITFSLVNDKLAGAKQATVLLINKIGGVDATFTVSPALLLGQLTKVSSTPIDDTVDKGALTLYKLPTGTSDMKIKVLSYGGSTLTSDNDACVTVTKSPVARSSVTQDENEAYYTLTAVAPGTATLTHTNRTDATKTENYTVNVIASDITGDSDLSLQAIDGQSGTAAISSPKGFTVAIADYGASQGGKLWLKLNTPDLAGGANKQVSVSAISELSNVRPVTLKLTNKIKDGGDKIVTVTAGTGAPVLTKAGNADPVQNTLTGSTTAATMMLYRVSNSAMTIDANGVGGSEVADPVGVTVTGAGGFASKNSYTVTLNNGATGGSFKIVNKSEPTKITTVTVTAPVATMTAANISALSVIANQQGTSAVTSPEGFTTTVSWGGGNSWFGTTASDFAKGSQTITAKVNATLNNLNVKQATVTLTNKIARGENLTFTVTPTLAAPTIAAQGGASPVQNSMTGNTIKLYRVTGSKHTVRVTAIGGSKVSASTGVTVTGGNNANNVNDYVVTLANNTTASGSVTFCNFSDNSKTAAASITAPVTVNTAPVNKTVNLKQESEYFDNSVNFPEGFTASVTSWGGGGTWINLSQTDYASGTQNVRFQSWGSSINSIVKTATITLKNKIVGGEDKIFTVTPVFSAPVLSENSAYGVPSQNSLSNNTIKLYQVPSSSLRVFVTAVGGTRLGSVNGCTVTRQDSDPFGFNCHYTASGNTGGWFEIESAQDASKKVRVTVNALSAAIVADNKNLEIPYNNIGFGIKAPEGCKAEVTNWNGGGQWFTYTLTPEPGGATMLITLVANKNSVIMKPTTIRLTNNIAGGPNKDIVITPINFSAPTVGGALSRRLENVINENSTSTIFDVTGVPGSYDYTVTNPAIVDVVKNNDQFTVKAKLQGKTTIVFKNASDNSKTSTVTVDVARSYNNLSVYKFNGYYLASDVVNGGMHWNNAINNLCTSQKGSSWFVPSKDDWLKIIGASSENVEGTAGPAILKSNIFGQYNYYAWSTTEYNSGDAWGMRQRYQNGIVVSRRVKTNNDTVRCVSK